VGAELAVACFCKDDIKQFSALPPTFLELPGQRLIYDSEVPASYGRLMSELKIRRL
jgi:hypothetical protein